MADTIHQVDWTELLPEGLKQDPRYLAMLRAIAEQKRKIAAEIWRATIWPNFQGLSEDAMNVLLYDMDIAGEEFRGSAESTRELLVKGRGLKKNAGTKSAVIEALKTIYTSDCKLEEWFEYAGDPYTFRLKIDVTDQIVNLVRHQRALDLVEQYKNVRSHLGEVEYDANLTKYPAAVHIGGAMATITRMPLPELPDKLKFESTLYCGGLVAAEIKQRMPEISDAYQFESTLHGGGTMTAESILVVPERADLSMLHRGRIGGRGNVTTTISVPEIQQ